jgi:CHAT domain-containing protein
MTAQVAVQALNNAGYLHAACHGVADPDHPGRSGLELEGGRLTIDHLSGLRTGLELSILSACETNVPNFDHPDEAMGLAAGIHLAGSRGVIASSWRVPDTATAALMDGFYQRWRGPAALSPSEALRQAQLELADGKRWHSAYYWAGFSFVGSPSS